MRRLVFLSALLCVGCQVSLEPSCNARGEVDSAPPAGPDADAVDDAPAPVCPGPRTDGRTECFSDCSAGQFCDGRSGLEQCRPGCTSDANCGRTEQCVRSDGRAIGRCESCRNLTFGEPSDGCVDAGRTGITPCFSACAPGQYCVDTGLQHCEPGCVSDSNCGPTERCNRLPGAAVGVCGSCYPVAL